MCFCLCHGFSWAFTLISWEISIFTTVGCDISRLTFQQNIETGFKRADRGSQDLRVTVDGEEALAGERVHIAVPGARQVLDTDTTRRRHPHHPQPATSGSRQPRRYGLPVAARARHQAH